jgi:hypothetical protein
LEVDLFFILFFGGGGSSPKDEFENKFAKKTNKFVGVKKE